MPCAEEKTGIQAQQCYCLQKCHSSLPSTQNKPLMLLYIHFFLHFLVGPMGILGTHSNTENSATANCLMVGLNHMLSLSPMFSYLSLLANSTHFYNEYVIQALLRHKLDLLPAARVTCFAR